ncbi:MAG: PEP-CTERM sorting domain-containing protein [Phycisphaerae bacterium]|nr:PEP-CTERM sorting domain-containing protein [Phycisphaerae bacterium]
MRNAYALALCLLVGVSSNVFALTTFDQVAIPITATGNGMVIQLNKFNSSLGNLTGIELYLECNAFSGVIKWDNESSSPTHVTLGIGAEVTAEAPDALTLIVLPLQEGDADVDADNDGDPDFLGSDAFAITGGSGNDTDSDNPADFDPYIGSGKFDVTISSVGKTQSGTTGGLNGELISTAGEYSGLVRVTYTYDVPEPMTLALLGGGGAVLFFRRKRR